MCVSGGDGVVPGLEVAHLVLMIFLLAAQTPPPPLAMASPGKCGIGEALQGLEAAAGYLSRQAAFPPAGASWGSPRLPGIQAGRVMD